MKTLREEIESIKFKCPDCVLPHNLSSLETDKILKVIAKRDEECVGEDVKPISIEAAEKIVEINGQEVSLFDVIQQNASEVMNINLEKQQIREQLKNSLS